MQSILSDFNEIHQLIRPRFDEKAIQRIGVSMRKTFIERVKEINKERPESTENISLQYPLLGMDALLLNTAKEKNKIVKSGIGCSDAYLSSFHFIDDKNVKMITVKYDDFVYIIEMALYNANKMESNDSISSDDEEEEEESATSSQSNTKRPRYEEEEEQAKPKLFSASSSEIYANTAEEFLQKGCVIVPGQRAPHTDHRVFYLLYVYWLAVRGRLDFMSPEEFRSYLFKHHADFMKERVFKSNAKQRPLAQIQRIKPDIPELDSLYDEKQPPQYVNNIRVKVPQIPPFYTIDKKPVKYCT